MSSIEYEKRKDYFKKYRETHKEERKLYRDTHKSERKKWLEENKEKVRIQKTIYEKEHREQINRRRRERRKTDSLYHLKESVRNLIYKSFIRTNFPKQEEAEIILGISVKEFKKYIENNFPKVSAITMLDTDNNSGNKWIAINSKETNKFKALEKLCSSLNINLNQVIYFGDSTNDLPIINKVGLGIAMGNAIQEVKEQAKDITLSNDEDGIASFLEKIKN